MQTLEPIRPVENTPYGAMIIGRDLLCTPTSLCTWSYDETDGDGSVKPKPVVYCKQPEHTLNPICQRTNSGIGLMGCYDEKTCGGMAPNPSTTDELLRKKPQYINILQKEEDRVAKLQNKKRMKTNHIILISISVCLALLILILLLFAYRKHRKNRRHHRRITQTQKH